MEWTPPLQLKKKDEVEKETWDGEASYGGKTCFYPFPLLVRLLAPCSCPLLELWWTILS